MKNKITARQIPPEHQESPLRYEDVPPNVYIWGNPHYIEHRGRIDEIETALDDLSSELENLEMGRGYYKTWIETLENIFPHDATRGEYTRDERKTKIPDLLEKYENGANFHEAYADALTLITGREHKTATIRGVCQGDWNMIIYPAEYGREWVKTFETEYFNLGTEWEIDENGNTYYLYCTTDDPRAEIAEITNTQPEEIKLLYFDGWTKTPKYTEVSPW